MNYHYNLRIAINAAHFNQYNIHDVIIMAIGIQPIGFLCMYACSEKGLICTSIYRYCRRTYVYMYDVWAGAPFDSPIACYIIVMLFNIGTIYTH